MTSFMTGDLLILPATVCEQAAGPKELVVVPGARHINLHDHMDFMPFDKFFTTRVRVTPPVFWRFLTGRSGTVILEL